MSPVEYQANAIKTLHVLRGLLTIHRVNVVKITHKVGHKKSKLLYLHAVNTKKHG